MIGERPRLERWCSIPFAAVRKKPRHSGGDDHRVGVGELVVLLG